MAMGEIFIATNSLKRSEGIELLVELVHVRLQLKNCKRPNKKTKKTCKLYTIEVQNVVKFASVFFCLLVKDKIIPPGCRWGASATAAD